MSARSITSVPLAGGPVPGDRAAAWQVAIDALKKAREHRAVLHAVFRDLVTLASLVKAWAAGRYTEIPWRTILMATGALVYFLNPLDVVPDPVPFAGYLDDATVIGVVAAAIRRDVQRFRRWQDRPWPTAEEPQRG